MTRTPKVMQTANNPTRPSSQAPNAQARQPVDPVIRSFPSEPRKAPRAWAAWLTGLCGGLTAAAGAAMVWGPEQSPELADLAAQLDAAGILAGHLFASGGALIGLSLIGLYVGRVARTLLRPGAVEDALTEVGADLAEYRNKLYEFQNDHVHFRATLEGVVKEVREHREKDRSQEAIDALFRMAGSLDTLHARFDQKLTETSQGIGQTMSELGGVIEAARDYLQDSLEETDQRVELLANQMTELMERPVPQIMAPGSSEVDEPAAAQPEYVPMDVEPEGSPGPELSLEPSGDEPLGLGLLDELDDLESESWCDEEVQQEMAALEEARSSANKDENDGSPTQPESPQADQSSNAPPSLVSLDPVPVPAMPAIPAPVAIEPPAPTPAPEFNKSEEGAPQPPPLSLDQPQAPLPSAEKPTEESASRLDEMTDVVRDSTSARIVEGLDFSDDGQA